MTLNSKPSGGTGSRGIGVVSEHDEDSIDILLPLAQPAYGGARLSREFVLMNPNHS